MKSSKRRARRATSPQSSPPSVMHPPSLTSSSTSTFMTRALFTWLWSNVRRRDVVGPHPSTASFCSIRISIATPSSILAWHASRYACLSFPSSPVEGLGTGLVGRCARIWPLPWFYFWVGMHTACLSSAPPTSFPRCNALPNLSNFYAQQSRKVGW